jgi:hypothetical protein
VALACFVLVVAPLRARADDRHRILVLIEKDEPVFLPRLLAELGASGFDAAVATPSAFPPDRAEVEQLSQREGATVELVLVEAGRGLEIWMVNPSTGKASFHEVILSLYEPDQAPEMIAIRVVETLRARLMELPTAQGAAPAVAPAVAPRPPVESVPPPARPRAARFTIAVGGAGAYSAGGVGAMAQVDLSFGVRVGSRFTVSVDGAMTPVRTTVEGPEGKASVGWYLAGLSLGFCASDPAAPVRFRSGAGAWLSLMTLSGQASLPYVGMSANVASVIPHLDEGLHISITPNVSLAADLSLGVSLPEASIQFAGRQVATWGRPLWIGGLALESALDR